jgi:mRNA interferase YafQ
MRRIERSTAFRRDYKREAKGKHRATLDGDLLPILTALVNDHTLPARQRDHALSNNWYGHRECHIRPDLLLIYNKPDDDTLHLVRIGTHSELFG